MFEAEARELQATSAGWNKAKNFAQGANRNYRS